MTTSPSASGIVIIGGGICGIATAYYLAREGIASTVIERDSLASHASGFAYGGLHPFSGSDIPGALTGMARRGFELHRALAPELLRFDSFRGHSAFKFSVLSALLKKRGLTRLTVKVERLVMLLPVPEAGDPKLKTAADVALALRKVKTTGGYWAARHDGGQPHFAQHDGGGGRDSGRVGVCAG